MCNRRLHLYYSYLSSSQHKIPGALVLEQTSCILASHFVADVTSKNFGAATACSDGTGTNSTTCTAIGKALGYGCHYNGTACGPGEGRENCWTAELGPTKC